MKGFYEVRLAPIISDLSQVVVSLGLISVSLGYVNAVLADPGVLSSGAFWIRLLALLATVSFTCYFLLSYVADMENADDTSWAHNSRSPSRIIALFLLDLLMLGEQGWMYGVLVLGDFSNFGELTSMQALAMKTGHFVMLAGLAAAWHATTLVWHLLAGSKHTAQVTHLMFFGAFGILCLIATQVDLPSALAQFLWIGAFIAVVMTLFFYRGRMLIRNAITAHQHVR